MSELAARHFRGAGGAGGADVFVVSVRWTLDEPSGCWVVVSLVSDVELLPVSVVVVDCVRVVTVDFGGALLAQAATPSVDAINKRWPTFQQFLHVPTWSRPARTVLQGRSCRRVAGRTSHRRKTATLWLCRRAWWAAPPAPVRRPGSASRRTRRVGAAYLSQRRIAAPTATRTPSRARAPNPMPRSQA